jgi:hypothetical protein
VPHRVVPQVAGDEPRQPEPTDDVARIASSVLRERVERTPQRLDAGDVAFREARRKSVEQDVGRSRRLSSDGRSLSSRGHLRRADVAVEAAREDRGSDRFEVNLARRSAVERLEPVRCLEQQRRSVAAASEREHDLRAQTGEPRALKLVQRTPLRNRQKLVRCLRRA